MTADGKEGWAGSIWTGRKEGRTEGKRGREREKEGEKEGEKERENKFGEWMIKRDERQRDRHDKRAPSKPDHVDSCYMQIAHMHPSIHWLCAFGEGSHLIAFLCFLASNCICPARKGAGAEKGPPALSFVSRPDGKEVWCKAKERKEEKRGP